MNTTDILTNIGVLVGTATAAWIAYKSKKPEAPPQITSSNAIVAGVGIELGNKDQNERLISEVKRCADSLAVLADRRQAATEDKLEEILDRLAEKERRN